MKKEVISQEQILLRIRELGQQLSLDYTGKQLVLLGVLKGAFIFIADLCRVIDLDFEIDFIRVASYGNETDSSGTIRLTKEPEVDLTGKDILLIEDIIDTGITMQWLGKHFKESGAKSVKICTLVDKSERRKVDIDINYSGFALTEGFLIGYGLDYAEKFRNLPAIYTLVEEG